MRRAFFRAFTFAICICEDIVFNTLQYTFAVSNVGLMRVVATPGFSNKIRNYHGQFETYQVILNRLDYSYRKKCSRRGYARANLV